MKEAVMFCLMENDKYVSGVTPMGFRTVTDDLARAAFLTERDVARLDPVFANCTIIKVVCKLSVHPDASSTDSLKRMKLE